jgi:calmodulin
MTHRDAPPTPEANEALRVAFRSYDQDGDGYVTIDELRRLLAGQGEHLTQSELEEVIRDLDTDGDGRVSFEEFVAATTLI